MTLASSLLRRRRVLVLCAVTVLLHYLTIGWVGARIGIDAPSAPPEKTPTAIVARLHAPVPVAAPSAPAKVPKPRRERRAKAEQAPPAQRAPAPEPLAQPAPASEEQMTEAEA